MKKILVTGGAGFIGSHTCINLLEKGYAVVIFDSFINILPRFCVLGTINKLRVSCNIKKKMLELLNQNHLPEEEY